MGLPVRTAFKTARGGARGVLAGSADFLTVPHQSSVETFGSSSCLLSYAKPALLGNV